MKNIALNCVLILSSSIIYGAAMIAKETAPIYDDGISFYVFYMILAAVVGIWNVFSLYVKTSEPKKKETK